MKDKSHPTSDNMWINVKGVVDGVDGAPPVVSLAEGERTSVYTDAQHVRIPSQ